MTLTTRLAVAMVAVVVSTVAVPMLAVDRTMQDALRPAALEGRRSSRCRSGGCDRWWWPRRARW